LQAEVPVVHQGIIRKFAALFNKLFDMLLDDLSYLAAFVLGFIALAVTLEIITRYFFNDPWLWTIEITQYCQVWVTFLCAAWILRKEGHVIVDFLPNMLNPKARTLLYACLSFLGIIVCLIYSWYGVQVTAELFQKGRQMSTILMPPSYLLYIIIPIGNILLTIQFIRRTVILANKYRGLKKTHPG
jgi:TRAP-type C4-dicarboxylate transport system permease small subunit